MMDFLDVVRALNTVALVIVGFILISAGVVLHVDIKKNNRNGISHALRNLLFASAALMFTSASFPIWVNFRGVTGNYEDVVTALYCLRLGSLGAMAWYIYTLVKAMLCANSGEC